MQSIPDKKITEYPLLQADGTRLLLKMSADLFVVDLTDSVIRTSILKQVELNLRRSRSKSQ